MAKFRNIHKRRDHRTGKKKVSSYNRLLRALRGDVAERKIVIAGMAELNREMVRDDAAILDDGDIQPLGVVPVAGDSLVRYFSRLIIHLRRWFRGFWSAPRWTHPVGWLLTGQNRARLS